MKKKKIIIYSILSIIILPILIVAWVILKESQISSQELDYIRAYKDNGKLYVSGAWDAPGGAYLSTAYHYYREDKLTIRLYGKITLFKSRIFNLRIPVTKIPTNVFIENKANNYTNLQVKKESFSGMGLSLSSKKIE